LWWVVRQIAAIQFDESSTTDTVVKSARSSWRAVISEREKQAEEQEKIAEEKAKEMEKFVKEETKAAEEELKRQVDAYEDAYDAIGKAIKDSEKNADWFRKEIEKSRKSIEDFDAAIRGIEFDTEQQLANRFIEVQDRLKEIDENRTWTSEEVKERAALQEELAILRQNVSQATIDDQKAIQELSETEKILRERQKAIIEESFGDISQAERSEIFNTDETLFADEIVKRRRQQLEDQLIDQQIALDEELGRQKLLREAEKALAEEAIEVTRNEFQAKEQAAKGYEQRLDSIIQKTIQLNNVTWWASLGVASPVLARTWPITNQAPIQVIVDATVNENADFELLEQSIINAIQTSQQT